MACKLVLQDSTEFVGDSTSNKEVSGEVVFNTSMTGYPESLTDPSYRGQILVATQPEIGNYGFSEEWAQSSQIQVEAFVVRQVNAPSHRKGTRTLQQVLEDQGVPLITGVDTRALTRKLRASGTMNGTVGDEYSPPPHRDLVKEVTTKKKYSLGAGRKTVAVIDCGVKLRILQELLKRGLSLDVYPADEKPKNFDALFVSNGPGDPKDAPCISTVRDIYEGVPTLGICLGHQIIALATGGDTYKLKFGHRGGNHGVMTPNGVVITSQNHGYAVNSAPGFELTHTNLMDQSNEGMKHSFLPVIGVQYHPEASPGPHDSLTTFDEFAGLVNE